MKVNEVLKQLNLDWAEQLGRKVDVKKEDSIYHVEKNKVICEGQRGSWSFSKSK